MSYEPSLSDIVEGFFRYNQTSIDILCKRVGITREELLRVVLELGLAKCKVRHALCPWLHGVAFTGK